MISRPRLIFPNTVIMKATLNLILPYITYPGLKHSVNVYTDIGMISNQLAILFVFHPTVKFPNTITLS